MARIYAPLLRRADQRWDFTISSDEECWVHPTGYCAGYKDPAQSDADAAAHGWPKMSDEEREKILRLKGKFHSDGHATADEAVECHRQYELDFMWREGTSEDVAHKCVVCQAWTQTQVNVGSFSRWWLCTDHRSRESVEALMRK